MYNYNFNSNSNSNFTELRNRTISRDYAVYLSAQRRTRKSSVRFYHREHSIIKPTQRYCETIWVRIKHFLKDVYITVSCIQKLRNSMLVKHIHVDRKAALDWVVLTGVDCSSGTQSTSRSCLVWSALPRCVPNLRFILLNYMRKTHLRSTFSQRS